MSVDDVATQIQNEFCAQMRARGGRWTRYTPGESQIRFFRKAAELCLQHGLSPIDHVMSLSLQVRDPLPYMLCGDRAVERTKSFSVAAPGHEARLFLAQVARLFGMVRSGDSLTRALLDPNAELYSSFRFAVALQAGLAVVASRYRDAAERELSTHPHRRSLMSRFLPSAMTQVMANSAGGR